MTPERSCRDCVHRSCAISHQWGETDCRFFTAKKYANAPGKDYPDCKRKSCTANEGGRCLALNDTDFGGRSCPFYKKKVGL